MPPPPYCSGIAIPRNPYLPAEREHLARRQRRRAPTRGSAATTSLATHAENDSRKASCSVLEERAHGARSYEARPRCSEGDHPDDDRHGQEEQEHGDPDPPAVVVVEPERERPLRPGRSGRACASSMPVSAITGQPSVATWKITTDRHDRRCTPARSTTRRRAARARSRSACARDRRSMPPYHQPIGPPAA